MWRVGNQISANEYITHFVVSETQPEHPASYPTVLPCPFNRTQRSLTRGRKRRLIIFVNIRTIPKHKPSAFDSLGVLTHLLFHKIWKITVDFTELSAVCSSWAKTPHPSHRSSVHKMHLYRCLATFETSSLLINIRDVAYLRTAMCVSTTDTMQPATTVSAETRLTDCHDDWSSQPNYSLCH
jgi:hypothetical protein